MDSNNQVTEWAEEAKPTQFVRRQGLFNAKVQAKQASMLPEQVYSIATWNVSAINSNPFEYWMSYPDDPNYDKMMKAVEDFISSPGDKDVLVSEVFTDEMFKQLNQKMTETGWDHLDDVVEFWENDFKTRKIISGFLQDKLLGKKRLMSMGDRITNTLNTRDGTVYRPTIINAYTEDMNTVVEWWGKWLDFMFETTVTMTTKRGETSGKICKLLVPIKKAKYEAITEKEEQVSIPLQTLCLAIFDAVLLHIVNLVSPGCWSTIKKSLCNSLILNKPQRCCKVIDSFYSDMSIFCLQEVSAVMIDMLRLEFDSKYFVVAPFDSDGTRDQNSVLLLSKSRFSEDGQIEITQEILATFPPERAASVMAGDLIVMLCKTLDGKECVIASFHGDSNGKSTPLVLSQVVNYVNGKYPTAKFFFGIDANSCGNTDSEKLNVVDFMTLCSQHELDTNWGNTIKKGNEAYTSYIGRSFLQPQLQKGIKYSDLINKGDRDLKDYILFKHGQLEMTKFWKDCSGRGEWLENCIMPTYDFPSDHAILAMTVIDRSPH